jgi:hypothetical protein
MTTCVAEAAAAEAAAAGAAALEAGPEAATAAAEAAAAAAPAPATRRRVHFEDTPLADLYPPRYTRRSDRLRFRYY